ncbi:MAG: (2Fe-2S) ferredoxin domain-containing protein [Clostridiales bacterium]|jgi:(2Fe-2S) ferredoxin|nr:(2Fe-2S) ferredoxin domain-containing protein [Clostridiales bacterium]MDR2751457.1 (2Fe-2S) ferredoxin domain-containing protein [Clostridiales bacterium]
MVAPKHHVFVCSGAKLVGDKKGTCNSRGCIEVARKFMDEIDERELSGDVMVSTASCFSLCSKGPVVLVYPEGVWYGGVTPEDVEEIAEQHLENGEPVKRLVL